MDFCHWVILLILTGIPTNQEGMCKVVMLFSPYKIKNVELKNRIVMSPMCMYSSRKKDGMVSNWHKTHYSSRALGGVGLIITESTAVEPQGRISVYDLGIWDDKHVDGLKSLVDFVHENGSKIGVQLSHAGRKADVEGDVIGPSSIPYKDDMKIPIEMSIDDIDCTINNFKEAARRTKEAGFDLIEIHAAHGYLINQFLSSLSNKRKDQYGGSRENRYRFLKEIVNAIKSEWNGPLFVRISANEYHPDGNSLDDYIYFSQRMKEQGVDLVDCSSGAIVPAYIDVFPGYQVPLAEKIKHATNIATGAVGLITSAIQAEEILRNNRADLIFIGRELLRDPFWALRAAISLGHSIEGPVQYKRSWKEVLPIEESSLEQRWAPGKELTKSPK